MDIRNLFKKEKKIEERGEGGIFNFTTYNSLTSYTDQKSLNLSAV